LRNLEKIVSKIESELDEKDAIREVALKSSRVVVRLSGKVLRRLHKGEDVRDDLQELRDEVSRLSGLVGEHPDIALAGYVESALQEYSEACILLELLDKDDLPTPEDIGVGNIPYLLGLADGVGELRRLCLDSLKASDISRANHFLERMEDIFTALMRFDYPDAIVAIRRKQDVARSLLEKTRGEVAVATSAMNLHKKMDEVLKRS